MKILYIPLQFHPIQGGYSLASINFLKSLAFNNDISIDVLSITNLNGKEEFQLKGVNVTRIKKKGDNLFGNILVQFSLFSYIKKNHNKYDIIFFETGENSPALFILSKFKKIAEKIMIRFHASTDTEGFLWYPSLELRIRKILIKKALKKINFIISTNNYHKHFIKKYFYDENIYKIAEKKLFILPNTLSISTPVEKLANLKLPIEKGKYFLILGRLSNQGFLEKGIDDIIHAIILLKRDSFDFKDNKFVIIGQGENKVFIQNLIEKNGLQDICIMIDIMDNTNIHLLQKESRACIMNSRLEGCSMFALEAIFNEGLLIATDVGGLRDLLVDGYNGFFTKPQDILSLSENIKKVISLDDSEVCVMKKNSKNFYNENFSNQKVSNDFEKIITVFKNNIKCKK